MNDPIGSASRPITEFDYDAEDIPHIIQAIGYSRFSAQYLPGAIHRPIAYPPDVLDSLRPFPDSNSGPRPRGRLIGRMTQVFLSTPQILQSSRERSPRARRVRGMFSFYYWNIG
ncbi:uncharacterized protein FPRO_14537 [Fusarium proliferatum ET1]|uniref:Uncharacterized protein n=1 Tax=Fusarium proliferatum (strain ET1) TaxID=1227346 RepID=A0A1L7VWF9_FUSPR|nr:uncharacterized protein FPRO_14537 [Fusarium proliferatum ET1]CZR44785.1 uncharacterized protein FPRO_14537 [Fusarium proliferatum ET1]